ncbi:MULTISPECIES: hypothetical protein [Burkholderia cepacia complex]|uniref:hypothetical protein n=1 Tax=Burkholderia cepacia complex TaxID=87882 RepID=UPI0012D8A96F|nr:MULTISPECIES: hypothetical protein [Burkholderia cepacia complex]MBU9365877.1 hypothetical protein [Burkholderia multivorans]MCO1442545.1 hypothetical protein [Burkholderia multivorans]MDN8045465.1 hypothetical protein [Burkholderia vietnamiensis]UQO27607.1 hypothetical protein L0Z21_11590 [Burkholderia multivorans]UQO40934.1 hypothetical protein L0Z43_12090 [Burkholderia multivorans]
MPAKNQPGVSRAPKKATRHYRRIEKESTEINAGAGGDVRSARERWYGIHAGIHRSGQFPYAYTCARASAVQLVLAVRIAYCNATPAIAAGRRRRSPPATPTELR